MCSVIIWLRSVVNGLTMCIKQDRSVINDLGGSDDKPALESLHIPDSDGLVP